MKKQKDVEEFRPLPHDLVRFKEMGNITEIMYSEKRNCTCKIKKVDENSYINLDTGELLNFEHIENRADDKNSIRVSLGKLRDYLNTNITDTKKCRWVTLTYAENMTDTKKLYDDFRKYNMRLKYHFGHFEYIVAVEPQGRGAWHCHVVMIFADIAPYIENKLLSEIWGHGFVTVKKLDDVDNVGAYLTAYLGDMELDEAKQAKISVLNKEIKEVEFLNDKGIKESKYYIKGARLSMYPPNFNLYRCSKGIKKPIIDYMSCEKAEKKVSADTLTYETTISINDTETGFENTINYRYYNAKRR